MTWHFSMWGAVILLAVVSTEGALAPQHGTPSLLTAGDQHPLMRSEAKRNGAFLVNYAAERAPTQGNPLAEHAGTYIALVLIVVVVGACLCCMGTTAVVATVAAAVVYISNLPCFKIEAKQEERAKELPDEVKLHVDSQEFREFVETVYSRDRGLSFTEVVAKTYGWELCKDSTFRQVYKLTPEVEGPQYNEWDKLDLAHTFRYFETIQFIQQKKISLPELGRRKMVTRLAMYSVDSERVRIQAELPESFQRHVESAEFEEFCAKAFAELPKNGEKTSAEAAKKAVIKVYSKECEKDDVFQKAFENDQAMWSKDDLLAVFRYCECVQYKILKITSLPQQGTRVPANFRLARSRSTRDVGESSAAPPAAPASIEDA